MRYHVKGGIWKNTEDEILKAAVMKYGLNQWSRISSLLVRKSAKQCKERWYEWLDPQIKKTEWTKDEEEKLLHLAKMFPCQWRTIAPIVGRTAYQCMEHYERLLDRAQGREPDENDPRRLRPGEIDPNPETKPARPDPIDMEEDEKETINEARARLANTKGKKAKRKAREKQLEEARRLAALQKKRELKSAGIEVVLRLPRKKKKEMNYNIDVPFLRKVPEGSFQSGPEETPAVNKFKGAISLQYLENRNRAEDEEKFKKIDEKRMKNLKQKNLPDAIDKINKMNDALNIVQRNKLVLPEPQITENQLEGISKLSQTTMLPPYPRNHQSDYNSTRVLLGEYTNAPATPLTISKTPKIEDQIMKEAKIAVSIRESETPLVGGEHAKADLENYKNHRKTEVTLKNEFKTPALGQSVKTKLSKDTSKTPLRDDLNINSEDSAWENSSAVSSVKNHSVKFLLSNLPKPLNKYEIDFTDNSEELKQEINQSDVEMVEDSEDKNNRVSKEREEKERIDSLLRSQAVQRKLPRPYDVNKNYKSYSEIKISLQEDQDEEDKKNKLQAEEMIKNEMIRMVQSDSINHPIKGNRISADFEDNETELISLEEKEDAQRIIKNEMQQISNFI
jgi:pre-mRNA-splicing factor CDC5/CEF1